MIDRTHDLPVTRQCPLLNVARSTAYYEPVPISPPDLALLHRIDERHLESPFAGVRMLRDVLRKEGTLIGCKRVRTLMRKMGIQALYPKPRTSERCPVHPVFPYLLRDLIIDRPNPVWATEIVFTQMTKTDVLAARVGRDDITNFDLGIRHDNPIDQKIDPLTLLFEGGINQPPLNAGAELLDGDG